MDEKQKNTETKAAEGTTLGSHQNHKPHWYPMPKEPATSMEQTQSQAADAAAKKARDEDIENQRGYPLDK